MRTTRLRENIKKYLAANGESNTQHILEHINSIMRHGTTSQQLGNVLAKDKDIMKVSEPRRAGTLSGSYGICVWALRVPTAPE